MTSDHIQPSDHTLPSDRGHDRPVAGKKRPPTENRREPLQAAAADLFARKGFGATTIRDIAAAVGMFPGSVYYHFKSKEEIFLAVYRDGVANFKSAINAALEDAPLDPWARLEKACIAHLDVLLDNSTYARMITPEYVQTFPEPFHSEVVAERDRYEAIFADLIAALPLPESFDRWLFKVALFGSLNWTLSWYRPGRYSPHDIAREFIAIYRDGQGEKRDAGWLSEA